MAEHKERYYDFMTYLSDDGYIIFAKYQKDAILEISKASFWADAIKEMLKSSQLRKQREKRDCIGLNQYDIVVQAKKLEGDYGFVGDINPSDINDLYIEYVLRQDIVPVFCAITHDGHGNLLNCNADSVASSVAIATSRIAPVELIYCFERNGVLRDVDDPDSVISIITPSIYEDLRRDNIVADGMIPKIDNAFNAINRGVESVTIKHSDNILSDIGTTITA